MKKFEELHCWQEARKLVKDIYKMTAQEDYKRDYGLKDQIQRSAVSTMANIAEGYHSFSTQDRIRFFGYATRSCSEVLSHLYISKDIGYVDAETFDYLYEQINKTDKLTRAFIRYLRN
ncbi:MAG: four helix bundle protein [bacterium]|nr:four helix bundle protein [bacterium]MBU1918001.1 four helix bundle protein [bacterium]